MAEVEAEMRNWIRRWLGVNQLEERLRSHSRHLAFMEVLQTEVRELKRNLELARAAIRENTLPMEDRKAASDHIADEAIKKMQRGDSK